MINSSMRPDSFIQLQLAINGIKLAITINGDQIGDIIKVAKLAIL